MDEQVVNGLFKVVNGLIEASRVEVVDDVTIETMVNIATTIHPNVMVTEDIRKRLVQELSHSYKINQSETHMIDDGQYTPWLEEAESDEFYTKRYIDYLKD